MWWLYVILIIFGYLIYRGLSSNESSTDETSPYRTRQTGRNVNYTEDREKQSLIKSAKRQENMNNYDEASRLYLRAEQVFSAAKMKAMKGPQYADQAVELIKVKSPDRAEMITRNLANDFFYRLEQPATSAALLRSLGLVEEAEAVEVAAGISVAQTQSEPVQTSKTSSAPAAPTQFEQISEQEAEEDIETSDPIVESEHEIEVDQEEEPTPEIPADSYPNSMMMASSVLDDPCSVCKRDIKSGDSFIYCLNCGKPGHYQHLGEMIKVTGKCPICKQRLAPTMYEI